MNGKKFPNAFFSYTSIVRHFDDVQLRGLRNVPTNLLLVEADASYMPPEGIRIKVNSHFPLQNVFWYQQKYNHKRSSIVWDLKTDIRIVNFWQFKHCNQPRLYEIFSCFYMLSEFFKSYPLVEVNFYCTLMEMDIFFLLVTAKFVFLRIEFNYALIIA